MLYCHYRILRASFAASAPGVITAGVRLAAMRTQRHRYGHGEWGHGVATGWHVCRGAVCLLLSVLYRPVWSLSGAQLRAIDSAIHAASWLSAWHRASFGRSAAFVEVVTSGTPRSYMAFRARNHRPTPACPTRSSMRCLDAWIPGRFLHSIYVDTVQHRADARGCPAEPGRRHCWRPSIAYSADIGCL